MVFFSNKLTIGALLGCDIMGFNGMGLGKTQGKIFTGNNVFFPSNMGRFLDRSANGSNGWDISCDATIVEIG